MYLVLKLLHVLAVVLFLGNIYTGLFWKLIADRTRQPAIMAHTLDGIIRSDRWFTLPGVALIVVTGLITVMTGHLPVLRTGWIAWSLALFMLSGVVFVARVAPLQRQMRALAQGAEASGGGMLDWDRYRRLSLRWEAWGAVALLAPLAALALMVLKPRL